MTLAFVLLVEIVKYVCPSVSIAVISATLFGNWCLITPPFFPRSDHDFQQKSVCDSQLSSMFMTLSPFYKTLTSLHAYSCLKTLDLSEFS